MPAVVGTPGDQARGWFERWRAVLQASPDGSAGGKNRYHVYCSVDSLGGSASSHHPANGSSQLFCKFTPQPTMHISSFPSFFVYTVYLHTRARTKAHPHTNSITLALRPKFAIISALMFHRKTDYQEPQLSVSEMLPIPLSERVCFSPRCCH